MATLSNVATFLFLIAVYFLRSYQPCPTHNKAEEEQDRDRLLYVLPEHLLMVLRLVPPHQSQDEEDLGYLAQTLGIPFHLMG